MKTVKFFPNAYGPSNVEGIEGFFSYDVVEKAQLPHYDESGNTNFPVLISAKKVEELLELREKEQAHERRYADCKEPIRFLGCGVFSEQKNAVTKVERLEINIKIGDKKISLYSTNIRQTMSFCLYSEGNISLQIKSKEIDDDCLALNDAFNNHHPLRNQLFISSIVAYIKRDAKEIFKELGLTPLTPTETIHQVDGDEYENAGPNDYINSGLGYMVKKKDYAKAQKMGFDGIENL